MQYSYEFALHPKGLYVVVHVGLQSEFNLDFPHLWCDKHGDEAEVWFPRLDITASDVAHEGVHLVSWGIRRLLPVDYGLLVPRNDMAWGKSKAAVKEEAMARMMDRYVDTFYRHANANGLVILSEKPTAQKDE